MSSVWRSFCFAVFICLQTIQLAWAQPASKSAYSPKSPVDEAIRTMFASKTFEQTAISPDGKQVAWVERISPVETVIFVSAVQGGTPRRMTAAAAGKHSEDSIAWSPDSRRLAFLSDAVGAGQQQLYVASAAGGVATKLTSVKGVL